MPFVPLGAPQPLAIRGPFSALTIDAERRRVFAAGPQSVVILDADSGKRLATVRIGGARSFAVEPMGGHLFVGTSDGRISEIDPDRKTVVRSLDAGAAVGVLLYDSNSGRIYAGGSGRQSLATFDARTFAAAAPVPLAGRVPADLAADPVTGEFYVGFADRAEIAIVDPRRRTVRATFPTPGLSGNYIVRFDDALGQIVVVGSNGLLDVYDRAGTRLARINVAAEVIECALDAGDHEMACTDPAGLTFVQLRRDAAPLMSRTATAPGTALVVFDAKTNDAVVVRSDPDGSSATVQRFSPAGSASPAPRAS